MGLTHHWKVPFALYLDAFLLFREAVLKPIAGDVHGVML
jgi:hypothetical protein